MTEEILQRLVQCQEGSFPVALATIISTQGSTPCKIGTKMLIFPDGRTVGTIGGGCAEAEVRLKALTVLDQVRPCVTTISLLAADAADAGMVCGGIMDVFIQPV